MNEPAVQPESAPSMDLSVDGAPAPAAPPSAEAPGLQQRVERLEVAVEALKDTQALEERVVVRVTERLQSTVNALSDKVTANAPAAAARKPTAVEDTIARHPRGQYVWLFVDMYWSARLMFSMFFDRRYAMAWTTHMIAWLFIPAILTSGWWFPLAWLPIIGTYLDKTLDLLLAFCVYKALSRELRRYREVVLRDY